MVVSAYMHHWITHWIPPVMNAIGVLRTFSDGRFWLMCSTLIFLNGVNYVFETIDRRLIDSFGW